MAADGFGGLHFPSLEFLSRDACRRTGASCNTSTASNALQDADALEGVSGTSMPGSSKALCHQIFEGIGAVLSAFPRSEVTLRSSASLLSTSYPFQAFST
eukprot:1469593-Rhodomonas_salina.1